MPVFHVVFVVFLLVSAGTAAFAKSAPQDPKPKPECLVNASELPSGTPQVACPTRSSSPGSFCLCPKFSKDGNAEGYYVGTVR